MSKNKQIVKACKTWDTETHKMIGYEVMNIDSDGFLLSFPMGSSFMSPRVFKTPELAMKDYNERAINDKQAHK